MDAMFKLSCWCGVVGGGGRVAIDRILLFAFGQSCKYNIHSREIVEYSNELNIRLKIKETKRNR